MFCPNSSNQDWYLTSLLVVIINENLQNYSDILLAIICHLIIAGNLRCHITEIERNSSRISTVTVTDISLISMVLEDKNIWLTTSISFKRYVHWVTDIERFWGLFYIYKMIYCRHLINLNYSSSILHDYTGAHRNINELLRYNQEAHLCPCVPVFNLEPKSTLAIWM